MNFSSFRINIRIDCAMLEFIFEFKSENFNH